MKLAASETGFALVETLVATLIIAAMMGVTYEAVITNVRAARTVQYQRGSVLIAQSILSQVGSSIKLAPGTVTGRDGDTSWTVEMEPHAEDDAVQPGRAQLIDVRVSVVPDRLQHASVMLRSLRVAA